MSVPGEEVPHDTIDHDIDNSDDEDDNQRRKKKKKKSSLGFAWKFRSTKKVLLGSFPGKRDSRRMIPTRNEGVSGSPRCMFCVGRPQTLESPAESDTSDPNSPTFSHEMLRVLLEKNDFYCKECDSHLEVDELHCYKRAEIPWQDK